MSEQTPAAHARELLGIWEQAICAQPLRSLLPPDLVRARAHLEKLATRGELGARHVPDQLFFFYRIGTLLLRHNKPPTMSQFGEMLGVPLSSATRIVAWLTQAGYLARQPDPLDRRIVRVTLTAEGTQVHRLIGSFMRQRMEVLMRQFTAQERKDLIALAGKLVHTLAALNSQTSG